MSLDSLDADRTISLVEDLRYHAGERELVACGGEPKAGIEATTDRADRLEGPQ